MTDENSYIETDKEREEGHVDTRERNHECENKDPNLGCDMGIDVAGQLNPIFKLPGQHVIITQKGRTTYGSARIISYFAVAINCIIF